MSVLVASDLDRTLIYSSRALSLAGDDADAPLLTVSEVYDGKPLSFMTRAAEDQLAELSLVTDFVPVTTRTTEQFRRVRLPRVRFEYAVTTNGGVVLHEGRPDGDWAATVARRLDDSSAPLAEVEALLPAVGDTPWILRSHRADGFFLYLIVDRELMPAPELVALTSACADRGWTVSLQGRKLYLVPEPLTKSAALSEISSRLGASRVVAAGDSLLDLDMLEHADRAFRPAHGELHDLGVKLPHLVVTAQRGVLAGQELVALMTEAAASSRA